MHIQTCSGRVLIQPVLSCQVEARLGGQYQVVGVGHHGVKLAVVIVIEGEQGRLVPVYGLFVGHTPNAHTGTE